MKGEWDEGRVGEIEGHTVTTPFISHRMQVTAPGRISLSRAPPIYQGQLLSLSGHILFFKGIPPLFQGMFSILRASPLI